MEEWERCYELKEKVAFYTQHSHSLDYREPLIIINLSLPPRIKHGVNSGGSPVMSRVSGFLFSQE
jgi:hypothetical protein